MTVVEFRQAYGREALVAAGDRAGRISEWMSRADVKAVVINLPSQIPLYVQGDRVFWKVVDDLQRRTPPGVVFVPIRLPISTWNDFGMILRDPLFPEPENPRGLPVRSITPEEVSLLDPMELVLAVFRSRLNVPESQALGALTFRGADGQARLVLFSA